MPSSTLIRWSGVALLLGGALTVLFGLLGLSARQASTWAGAGEPPSRLTITPKPGVTS